MSTLPTKFLVYKTDDSNVTIDVIVDQETIWASQKSIAQLFGKSVSTINEHLKQIYSTEELSPESTIRKFRIVQNEGGHDVTRNINYYNLDAIISVGYRVNSIQATRFRQWATQTLKEYMIKGFVLDDERLKQGETLLGKDYFDELLERVRSIRASERRIWQKITDIFAEISVDYDKNSPITHRFYANVQNKFHYAITGQTAAEIIYHTADHNKEHMGLTTWKNAPDGRILKSDTTVAKNYLNRSL
ncbi:virulence RhuM family protein [Ligilactobacillus murinus]|nr:virulence RhuM family protein [Ligilactobacillus murinus]